MNLGTGAVEAAARWGRLPVDVHIMAQDTELVLRLLEGVPLAAIAVHAESTRYPRRVLRLVAETGRRAGLAINPFGAVPDVRALAPYLSYLLVLTTDPEQGEAPFIDRRLVVVTELAEQLAGTGIPIIVDGGVDDANARHIAAAGASGVVAGRALFRATDMAVTAARIRMGDTDGAG